LALRNLGEKRKRLRYPETAYESFWGLSGGGFGSHLKRKKKGREPHLGGGERKIFGKSFQQEGGTSFLLEGTGKKKRGVLLREEPSPEKGGTMPSRLTENGKKGKRLPTCVVKEKQRFFHCRE